MITTFMMSTFGAAVTSTQSFAIEPVKIPTWVDVNGTQTILAEKHDTPLVTFNIAFHAGGSFDPKEKMGLANFVGNMLLRGTKTKTREQIENRLDFLGASLGTDTGFHSLILRGQVLSQNVIPFIDLIAEILKEPAFSEDEIKKLRDEAIAQLNLRLEDDNGLARQQFNRAIFKGHPYANELSGTIESLNSIRKEDIVSFFKSKVIRNGMMIGAAGDITRETLNDIVSKITGVLPEGKVNDEKISFSPPVFKGRSIILVDKPDRTQTQFYIGHPAIDINHKDYFPLSIFMTAFAGHMFQAQYMQEIRVKRGWSYGAGGSVDARRDGGGFFLHTYPATKDTIPAIALSLELLENAVFGNGISDEQLNFAKTNIIRSFPFMIDTPEQLLAQLVVNRFLGRSDQYIQEYVSKVEAVTPKLAREAAKRHLNSKNLVISVLCTAKDLKDTIGKELGAASVEVVPYDKL